MATVSGVWVWNESIDFSSLIIGINGWQTIPVNFTSNGEEYTSIVVRQYNRKSQRDMEYDSITVYPYQSNAFTDENYRTVDFGSEPQTIISDRFYNFFIANAVQQTAPSVPTPDWANCFVKTSAGNKAVQKVWLKQNGQLVTVWDGGGGGGAAVDFATDSWETISAACKDGSYKTVYSVGDTKDITLSTGETITVAIMGFDHDDLSDGSGKAPITVAMENLLATKHRMNATNTNEGGWDECEMRTSTMATLLTQLPSDLQSVIKQVNKKATVGGTSTSITTSSDKLWLLAEVEVDGTTEAGYVDEGEQYEYWKTVKDGTVRADRIKYLSNGSGSANGWWLRSPSIPFTTNFRPISTQGGLDSNDANYNYGVCFGFCIG